VTAFHDAFTRAEATAKEARRLHDLDYRWNQRVRFWEHPDDPALVRAASRLTERRCTAIDAADDAHHQLNRIWHELSVTLSPHRQRTWLE
jgi:hypothetical protein